MDVPGGHHYDQSELQQEWDLSQMCPLVAYAEKSRAALLCSAGGTWPDQPQGNPRQIQDEGRATE